MGGLVSGWACYHGWATGPWFFEGLLQDLGGPAWRFDRGYFGTPSPDRPPRGDWKVITHSMGLWQVPPDWWAEAKELVVLGGFARFLPPQPSPTLRGYKRLVQGLERDLEGTLAQFYGLCFGPTGPVPKVPLGAKLEVLRTDLKRLGEVELDLEPLAQVPRILLLQGQEDQVVDPFLSKAFGLALPQADKVEVEAVGHGLGFSPWAPVTRAIGGWTSL
ncbi:MAG: hypothetical protein A2600_13835 [Candidatus Lambdaproteobacteria bacterium RIFOXYD1_FULL_56_27]|uniref:AB hydrolase-1 domain-containing protein n=1 Tax=Candidatus Lambdaproteobacteria bacterium RIFOXYD2_FULL_56_26 TaxID=1817773 RepID=A0A1F6GS09_9PROT|nr:MAG: hypothetical protein A2426_11150 [Candidatus Lambdaproteobacteria bacterium RIFOXYC1_FULL_56_13]OGH00870.1 MAG: hypothetical protein A2557_01925 [Candidatus Lambdaproteobacteria bacterium RIFOXYD2_FULL_56_26]OGH08697.1 MAG: hypothetical protein A2600_13835 [Candidatus Lambdaproteobacteria bacterium RIFOXYD1_FULL_56_27]